MRAQMQQEFGGRGPALARYFLITHPLPTIPLSFFFLERSVMLKPFKFFSVACRTRLSLWTAWCRDMRVRWRQRSGKYCKMTAFARVWRYLKRWRNR
jgi:hypothetical protein